MQASENRIKARLRAGEMQWGLWLSMSSPTSAEIAGGVGFDWVLIDGEHGPNLLTQTLDQARALGGSGTDIVLRLPSGDDWMIKQALDIGITTLLVPMVNSAAEAATIAGACKYPPEGTRGMGAILARASGYGAEADYATNANDRVCLIVQVESQAALDELEAIAQTPGVDAVFVGPADLSADMGFPGNPNAPEVQAAIASAYATLKRLGVPSGTVTFDMGEVGRLAEQGVKFLAVGGDALLLRSAMLARLAEAKDAAS